MDDTHIAKIQRNAIESWLNLKPRPSVVLIGNESGIDKLSDEFGVLRVKCTESSEWGTPTVRSIFSRVEEVSESPIVCYVNSDILLPQDFMMTVDVVAKQFRWFMLGLRPWNVDVTERSDSFAGWHTEMINRALRTNDLRPDMACDVFVFPRGMWRELPPLIIGRVGFDNALMRIAREGGGALVDGTPSVVAVHQNHDYPRHLQGELYHRNPEGILNAELMGGRDKLFGWKNATHAVVDGKVRRLWGNTLRSLPAVYDLQTGTRRLVENHLWYPTLRVTQPIRHRLGIRKRAG